MGGTYDENPVRDLDALSARAMQIYSGQVAEITPGFLDSQPGSLVQIAVTDVIRGPLASKSPNTVYLFVEHARFRSGNQSYCRGLWPLPLGVGDAIVVMATKSGADAGRVLLNEAASAYIVGDGVTGHVRFVSRSAVRRDVESRAITNIAEVVEHVRRQAYAK